LKRKIEFETCCEYYEISVDSNDNIYKIIVEQKDGRAGGEVFPYMVDTGQAQKWEILDEILDEEKENKEVDIFLKEQMIKELKIYTQDNKYRGIQKIVYK